jgi:hypothetical protein
MNHEQTLYFLARKCELDAKYQDPLALEYYIRDMVSPSNKYRIPIAVLWTNREAFRNRILGTIKDDWLIKERFEHISEVCFELLSEINNPEEWQITLKNKFQDFSGITSRNGSDLKCEAILKTGKRAGKLCGTKTDGSIKCKKHLKVM